MGFSTCMGSFSSEAKDETMEQKEILETPNHVVLSRMLTI